MNDRFAAPYLMHDVTAVGGQRAVLDAARAMQADGRAFAVAIVVSAEGSTYRKPGALALIGADGTHVGVISGGCLEPGLEVLAREALSAGAPRVTVFDTRSDDDLLFGSGSGCRGRMQVLALPFEPGRPGDAVAAIIRAGIERRSVTLSLAALAPDLFDAGEVSVQPSPHLFLVGASPEARPLLRIARTLGWYGSVADHRKALLAPDRIGVADHVVPLRPEPALNAVVAERLDAALVMTHVASTDLEALRGLATRDVPYIGLLGPPARRDELLASLAPAERDAIEPRLHAPVGLRLGGDGPEAIALAIAAELQSVFHVR